MVTITTIEVTYMSLLAFLKSNENARKIFGKRELKIIEKQLQGINLTQSEKNRLSRDIRKKLEFIKEASRFEDEFKLKKSSEIKKLIDETKEAILNDKLAPRIREIWLAGSAADNTLTFRSDVDIAVLFDKIDKEEAFRFRIRTSRDFSEKVDVQVLNVLPEKIQKSMCENHKVLYKNER